MKFFGLSRSTAACAAAGLFVFAQTVVFAQNFVVRPQAVVTKTDAYLPGAVQLIASADAEHVYAHPQGRYALIEQNEAALPPGSLTGQNNTGAVSLLLYDARLRKTRTLWERRADGGKHTVSQVEWLPETDCAVVITVDTPPIPVGEERGEGSSTLLFFDFEKSMSPRVLASSTVSWQFHVSVSPTKPLFVVQDEQQVRMGSAPRGVLGPPLPISPFILYGYGLGQWNAEGTSIYGAAQVVTRATPDAKPISVSKWYEWDGKSANATPLNAKPTKSMFAQSASPPALPIALRTGTLPVPTTLAVPPTPQTSPSKTPALPAMTVLHPLYLEALSDPTTAAANPNHSALLAPDAEKSYLLADQSAVLYHSGGALYAVPLVRVNSGVYAQVQKAKAMTNAKQVGLGILMYTQDYDEIFPPQDGFPKVVDPYLKNDAAFQGFTYISPGTVASVTMPATTIMGFIAAPGGRAVLYVDGHVKWEDIP